MKYPYASKKYIILALCIIISIYNITAQVGKAKYQPPETRILLIFDASQSMAGKWEKETKINIARKVLIHIIDSLEQLSNVQMALRLFGHQSPVPPQDCNDSRLVVPFARGNAPKIRQELRFINPKGTSPIAYSLEKGGTDFPPGCDNCRNIIIMITDGIEACEGNACAISNELQRKGIVLKPFIIGIGIDEGFRKTFDCIGNFYNATREEKFSEIMDVVISHVLNETTAQVNLLDINGNPTETNVNLTFYDQLSGKVIYNYVHTMNHRGLPDTLILDHMITYRMRVNTLPPVIVENIRLTPGKHTIIAADAPQGSLIIKTADPLQYKNMEFIVRKAGDNTTLNMQKMYSEQKYLVGRYDIEVPVLPRKYLNNVEIKQSHTTTIEIPRPGMVTFLKSAYGYGSVYLRKSNTDEEWVYNLDNRLKNETILLQPGSYRVVCRSQNAKQTLYTVNKTFDVKEGISVAVHLF